MKRIWAALLAVTLLLAGSINTFAHGGRTDGAGGHKDNKNASGLGYYHYHCNGNPPHLHTGGVCPYAGGTSSQTPSGSNSGSTAGSSQSSDKSKEGGITLSLAFGKRTGVYTGEYKNGLPHGKGTFTTTSESGVSWTYDGQWENGHMHGIGFTKWDTQEFEYGQYSNDVRSKKVTAVNDKYLTEKEQDNCYLTDSRDLCGRLLEIAGKIVTITEVGNADKDIILTVLVTAPESSATRHADFYIDRSVYKQTSFKVGQTISVSGVYYGGDAVKSVKEVEAYTYVPKVYVTRIKDGSAPQK